MYLFIYLFMYMCACVRAYVCIYIYIHIHTPRIAFIKYRGLKFLEGLHVRPLYTFVT
jgi:hypothetical protein